MSLVIVILIAFVVMFYLWRRNHVLYYNGFVAGMGSLNISIVKSYNLFHAPINYKPLDVFDNFLNYSGNLLLKFIHFVVFAFVVYFFGDNIAIFLILSSIYTILIVVAWFGYKGRRDFYNEIDDDGTKEVFTPILKASICIPIYQTMIYSLLFLV